MTSFGGLAVYRGPVRQVKMKLQEIKMGGNKLLNEPAELLAQS